MCSVELPENKIHETAIIHPSAVLGKGIEVGPYAIIDAETVIGDGCKIGPHAVIHKYTTIGKNCIFFPGCSIGADPQDSREHGQRIGLGTGGGVGDVLRQLLEGVVTGLRCLA